MCVLGLEPGAYNTCVDTLEEEEKKLGAWSARLGFDKS